MYWSDVFVYVFFSIAIYVRVCVPSASCLCHLFLSFVYIKTTKADIFQFFFYNYSLSCHGTSNQIKKLMALLSLQKIGKKVKYPREKKIKLRCPVWASRFTVCVYIAGHGSQFYLSNIVENRIQIHNGVLLPFYTYQIHNRVPFSLHLLRYSNSTNTTLQHSIESWGLRVEGKVFAELFDF